jgi:hypothetical protein
VFLGAARRMGTPAQNIEKDFWRIFRHLT